LITNTTNFAKVSDFGKVYDAKNNFETFWTAFL